MNRAEIERLAAAAHQLRPDWRYDSLVTLLTRVASARPAWDVGRELVWIALEPGMLPGEYVNETPKLLEENGPWRRALVPAASTPSPIGWCSLHGCADSQGSPCRACVDERRNALHDPELIAAIRAEYATTTTAEENA